MLRGGMGDVEVNLRVDSRRPVRSSRMPEVGMGVAFRQFKNHNQVQGGLGSKTATDPLCS
jgi:hypothetical protein